MSSCTFEAGYHGLGTCVTMSLLTLSFLPCPPLFFSMIVRVLNHIYLVQRDDHASSV